MDMAERENTLEFANVIISTYKSFGTGMDIEDIKYVLSLNQCNKITANRGMVLSQENLVKNNLAFIFGNDK